MDYFLMMMYSIRIIKGGNTLLKQQVLKPENIKSIELNANGSDKCYTNPIVINGLKAGKGVKAVKLDLVADKVPKVIIIGTPRLIPDEVKKRGA